MEKYVIRGGKPLHGEVEISGAKNAAVAIIPAAIMVQGVCRLENLPEISDVDTLLHILTYMGAKVRMINRTTVELDCTSVQMDVLPEKMWDMTRRIRASYYLIGAMLGRFGRACTTMPGGCNFGVRPIDQHIKGLTALGAKLNVSGGFITAAAENGLWGTTIYLDKVSVGATINIMIAAATAEGRTVIENVAREPHIVDLANFLNSMGADVRGAGTDTIKIRGVSRLHGGSYALIPDQIEAGTYMTAVAATGGSVRVSNVIPKHLECISSKLREMNVQIEEGDDYVLVHRDGPLQSTNLKTKPYPGFPTDMQPQMTAVLCSAPGESVVTESVWNGGRFKYVGELKKMGAQIEVEDRTAHVRGVDRLSGASVKACDLRAGAAMVIAGLAAEGVTYVEDITYIERGYENIVGKFRALGADIQYIELPDEPRAEQSADWVAG